MNERIKKLAIDCAGQMEWDAPKNPESFTFNRDELQKFAELIINACLGACIADIADPRDTVELKCAKKIKEHFGVTWVGLTKEERDSITDEVIGWNSCVGWEYEYACAIEAKLKEKNT